MTGRELRRIRKALVWTQAKLADAIGVTGNTIARQERGLVAIPEPVARLARMILAQHKGGKSDGHKKAKG